MQWSPVRERWCTTSTLARPRRGGERIGYGQWDVGFGDGLPRGDGVLLADRGESRGGFVQFHGRIVPDELARPQVGQSRPGREQVSGHLKPGAEDCQQRAKCQQRDRFESGVVNW